MYIQIAIDGPAGVGKSTTAVELARILNFIYLDTGAMYRALTYQVLMKGIDPKAKEDVLKEAKNFDLSYQIVDGKEEIFLAGKKVSEEIRSPEVSKMVSVISSIKEIREIMVEKQRTLASQENIVMDGRDIGSVVLPNASVKIFLTASAEERAKRRFLEMESKGQVADYEQVLFSIKERDYMDENREFSPLKAADDAIVLDTSHLKFEEVIDSILKIIKDKTEGVNHV